MARAKVNVYVVDPSTGAPVFVAAGSDLPEWAGAVVGGHVLDGDPDQEPDPEPDPEPAKRRRTRG